jgi:hypothetical protein
MLAKYIYIYILVIDRCSSEKTILLAPRSVRARVASSGNKIAVRKRPNAEALVERRARRKALRQPRTGTDGCTAMESASCPAGAPFPPSPPRRLPAKNIGKHAYMGFGFHCAETSGGCGWRRECGLISPKEFHGVVFIVFSRFHSWDKQMTGLTT